MRGPRHAAPVDRASILGVVQRVAYNLSASSPGVLPRTKLLCAKGKVTLTLPRDLADLAGERLNGRMKQLARLIGRAHEIAIGVRTGQARTSISIAKTRCAPGAIETTPGRSAYSPSNSAGAA